MGNILSKVLLCFENETEISNGVLDDTISNISEQISELFEFMNDIEVGGEFDFTDDEEFPFLDNEEQLLFGQLTDSDSEIELPILNELDFSNNDSENEPQIVEGVEEFPVLWDNNELAWDDFDNDNVQNDIFDLNRQQG